MFFFFAIFIRFSLSRMAGGVPHLLMPSTRIKSTESDRLCPRRRRRCGGQSSLRNTSLLSKNLRYSSDNVYEQAFLPLFSTRCFILCTHTFLVYDLLFFFDQLTIRSSACVAERASVFTPCICPISAPSRVLPFHVPKVSHFPSLNP